MSKLVIVIAIVIMILTLLLVGSLWVILARNAENSEWEEFMRGLEDEK